MSETTEIPLPPEPPAPRKRHTRRNILIAGFSAAILIGVVAGVATAGSGGKTASSGGGGASGSAAAGCQVLETWENSSTGSLDAATQARVEAAASGTTFATDFQDWATSPGTATADAVIADCTAAGYPDVLSGGTEPSFTAPAATPSASGPPPAPSTPPSPAAPQYTVSQEQAIDAAENYLSDEPGWSWQGLINQLSSSYGSGFSVSDATVAVNAIAPATDSAFWDTQAVDSANTYMTDEPGWSACSLVQQLDSPYGSYFTQAQAEYASQQVGLGTC